MNELISMDEWRMRMESHLDDFSKQEHVYPIDANSLRPPAGDLGMVPKELRALYAVSDGYSLPDIHVGYFADSVVRFLSATERGEPTCVMSRPGEEVLVFGSDGGGGRFAVVLGKGEILYLPSDGAVHDGVFQDDDVASCVRNIASSVEGFACRLLADVAAFVREDAGHEYMA